MGTIQDFINKIDSGEFLDEIKAKAIQNIKDQSQEYVCPTHGETPKIDDTHSEENEIKYSFCCEDLKKIFTDAQQS